MPAGAITLPGKDSTGAVRDIRFLSQDGTDTGDVASIHALVDSEGVLVDPASEATLAAVAAALTAIAGSVDGLETLITTLNGHVDGLETLVGTTNTGQATIAGYLDGLEGLATTLNGLVDGLEGLIGTGNSSLTALGGYVDGLEGQITTLNATMTAIAGYVDGQEALQGTTNAALATLAGHVDGLEALATTLNTYLDGVEGKLDTIISHVGPATGTARLISAAASDNAAVAKASPGRVMGIQGHNARAGAVYLKLYDKATTPTVGTDVPRKTIYLPASLPFAIDLNVAFAAGISYAMTTGGADANTTALTAGDVLGLNIDYA